MHICMISHHVLFFDNKLHNCCAIALFMYCIKCTDAQRGFFKSQNFWLNMFRSI